MGCPELCRWTSALRVANELRQVGDRKAADYLPQPVRHDETRDHPSIHQEYGKKKRK